MSNETKYKQLNLKLTAKQLNDLERLSNAMGNVSKSNLKARSELLGYIPIH